MDARRELYLMQYQIPAALQCLVADVHHPPSRPHMCVQNPCVGSGVDSVFSETKGSKIRVENIHYDLTEEDLDVRTCAGQETPSRG